MKPCVLMKTKLGLLALLLSSCQFINVPVTPMTLAGCWEGTSSLETIDARFDIRADKEPDDFIIDGSFNGLIDTDFKDYKVRFEEDQLKARGSSALVPVKIRVDNGRLVVSSLIPPTSFTMSRCN
jgi:hypothetical protein